MAALQYPRVLFTRFSTRGPRPVAGPLAITLIYLGRGVTKVNKAYDNDCSWLQRYSRQNDEHPYREEMCNIG